VAARRVADQVFLRFVLPTVNQDPSVPLSLSRVDIYARSLGFGSAAPVVSQLVRREFLVGSIDVRPAPSPDAPPPDPSAPVDARPAPGETVSWSEALRSFDMEPLAPTRAQQLAGASRVVPLPLAPSAVAVPFVRIALPARYYVAVGVSTQGRPGTPSAILPVRLGGAPQAPSAPVVTFTDTTLTVTWTTEAKAAVAVYESTPEGVESAAPVQAAPIRTGSWSTPVIFDVERCFVVRRVHIDGPVSTESAPAGPTCLTPADTFAPPALAAAPLGVAEPGRVILAWDPVTATDLAGYHVLRADGPGATLRPLTTSPVATTGYEDDTVRADVEYVYVIVAVDRAGNLSAQSPQVRVTGK
jgi:hypothetical protein